MYIRKQMRLTKSKIYEIQIHVLLDYIYLSISFDLSTFIMVNNIYTVII